MEVDVVANPRYLRLSPDDYLELERNATVRSEYEAGVAYLMAGASRPHTLIVGNFNGELRECFRSRPCESYTNDMKVWITAANSFYYPDIVAVCGERIFRDEREDVLLNPMVVVEVLSHSTERDDKGRKLRNYQLLPSLQSYVLIAQDEPFIQHYFRQADGRWGYESLQGVEEKLTLDAIGVVMNLSEIYLKVDFEEDNDFLAPD